MTGLIPSGRNQGGVRPPWFTAGLALVMLALYVAFGPQPDLFIYDRAGIEAGEWWRLLTGHLVHADVAHLAANVLALVILGGVLESLQRLGIKTVLLLVSFGIVVIDAVLWLELPGLVRYCGFSGVLNTLFIVAVYEQWRSSGDWLYRALAIGGLGKIAIESGSAGAVLPLSSLPSVTEAHFAGFVAGVVLCTLTAAWTARGGLPLCAVHTSTCSRRRVDLATCNSISTLCGTSAIPVRRRQTVRAPGR
jgi:rhomboid family GlyGly-CTERM serine protease